MTDRELMQQALDALTQANQCIFISAKLPFPPALNATSKAAEALRARLAQPEQEPVAWRQWVEGNPKLRGHWMLADPDVKDKCLPQGDWQPLYTAPPQREWQVLTENEIKHLWYEACQTNLELTSQLIVHLARNIEAKLKERNT